MTIEKIIYITRREIVIKYISKALTKKNISRQGEWDKLFF